MGVMEMALEVGLRAFVKGALAELPSASFDPTYEAGVVDGMREVLESVQRYLGDDENEARAVSVPLNPTDSMEKP